MNKLLISKITILKNREDFAEWAAHAGLLQSAAGAATPQDEGPTSYPCGVLAHRGTEVAPQLFFMYPGDAFFLADSLRKAELRQTNEHLRKLRALGRKTVVTHLHRGVGKRSTLCRKGCNGNGDRITRDIDKVTCEKCIDKYGSE